MVDTFEVVCNIMKVLYGLHWVTLDFVKRIILCFTVFYEESINSRKHLYNIYVTFPALEEGLDSNHSIHVKA